MTEFRETVGRQLGPLDAAAVDDTGTVWILADGLRHLPTGDTATAERLDVTALLESQAAYR